MPFTAQSIDNKCVNPEPEEIHDDWEEVTDNYGDPEVLVQDTVWVVKAKNEQEWLGYKAGDPVFLITRCRE